jgi:hypothetical protein
MWEGRGTCRVSVKEPEGKRLLGRRRGRWEDDIKVDIQQVGWGTWNGLIWLRTGRDSGHL